MHVQITRAAKTLRRLTKNRSESGSVEFFPQAKFAMKSLCSLSQPVSSFAFSVVVT